MGARDFGISFGQIAAKYKITRSTVSFVVYRAQKQDNGKTLSRSVRPKVLTPNDERHVLRILHCSPYSLYSLILAEVAAKNFLLTLQQFLC